MASPSTVRARTSSLYRTELLRSTSRVYTDRMRLPAPRHILRLALLPTPERGRLLRAGAALAAVRLAQCVVPHPRLSAWVATVRPAATAPAAATAAQAFDAPAAASAEARTIGAAVTRISSFVPRANCLTQALCAQLLLRRAGLPARVCLGARKSPSFAAHAWVELEGEIILGADPSYPELLPARGEQGRSPRGVSVSRSVQLGPDRERPSTPRGV